MNLKKLAALSTVIATAGGAQSSAPSKSVVKLRPVGDQKRASNFFRHSHPGAFYPETRESQKLEQCPVPFEELLGAQSGNAQIQEKDMGKIAEENKEDITPYDRLHKTEDRDDPFVTFLKLGAMIRYGTLSGVLGVLPDEFRPGPEFFRPFSPLLVMPTLTFSPLATKMLSEGLVDEVNSYLDSYAQKHPETIKHQPDGQPLEIENNEFAVINSTHIKSKHFKEKERNGFASFCVAAVIVQGLYTAWMRSVINNSKTIDLSKQENFDKLPQLDLNKLSPEQKERLKTAIQDGDILTSDKPNENIAEFSENNALIFISASPEKSLLFADLDRFNEYINPGIGLLIPDKHLKTQEPIKYQGLLKESIERSEAGEDLYSVQPQQADDQNLKGVFFQITQEQIQELLDHSSN